MTQAERRRYLIRSLMAERAEYRGMALPQGEDEQRRLLRSLMNVRPPRPADREFLSVQDDYLHRTLAEEGITRLAELRPVSGELYIWQGDITRLKLRADEGLELVHGVKTFIQLYRADLNDL